MLKSPSLTVSEKFLNCSIECHCLEIIGLYIFFSFFCLTSSGSFHKKMNDIYATIADFEEEDPYTSPYGFVVSGFDLFL